MKRSTKCTFCLLFTLLGGCAMQREPAWSQAGTGLMTERTENLFVTARDCFATAADRVSVDRCIAQHEVVLKDNPGHYQALANLSTLHILKGTAYTESSADKSAAFSRAMTYAELAMYTNPDFKARVDTGKQPWEAVNTLGAAEVEAMFFWATALQYEFKEGMSLPAKVINIGWMRHALVFLDRIETVAPEYGGGAVEFAKAICYTVLPESLGGSERKGDEYMQRSIDRGGGWLLPRWARGKYYLPHKGDDSGAAADLVWVAAQDPAAFRDPYPWRVHFQEEARQLSRERSEDHE